MTSAPAPIVRALDALPPVLDPAPLREALRVWDDPRRVVVLGRLGVGKSTLVNALAGEPLRPVGLGGVTDAEAEVVLPDGTIVVDTVGIDDEASALARLQPLLDHADAAIWITDGLQPMTATERRVVAGSLVAGTPLHVVVSKLDLTDDDQAEQVLERVRALAEPLWPASVRRLDLRRLDEAPGELVAPLPSPRRAQPVRRALDALADQLDALPEALSRAELTRRLRQRWTERVREAEGRVDARLASGAIDNKVAALERLVREGEATRDAFLEELARELPPSAEGLPHLPAPERPDTAPLRQVLASMSGMEGARRMLRAAAARWLAEGELVLLEWVEELEGIDEAAEARHTARRVLEAARAALDEVSAAPQDHSGSNTELSPP